ncbi:MAG: Rieske 2Fe-2S domain-containing protein [Mariprofundus sp.]
MSCAEAQWQQVARPEEGCATLFVLKSTLHLPSGQTIDIDGQGFVICYHGRLQAWKNECPHAGSPLDWIPGQFFSADGERLVCHTHHAEFEPLSGDCLSGPCPRGLYPLPFHELDHMIEVPRYAGAQ